MTIVFLFGIGAGFLISFIVDEVILRTHRSMLRRTLAIQLEELQKFKKAAREEVEGFNSWADEYSTNILRANSAPTKTQNQMEVSNLDISRHQKGEM